MGKEVCDAEFTMTDEDGEIIKTLFFTSFYGIPFRHPYIYQDPQVSGCCDMSRKNRTCSELVVSLNQALCVYSDSEMLTRSLPTTNDLINVLRDLYPAMFESIFEKASSVA